MTPRSFGQVAQLVEQWTENPATHFYRYSIILGKFAKLWRAGYSLDMSHDTSDNDYEALWIAAEKLGYKNYRAGIYAGRGYSITPEHQALIDAMQTVVRGTISHAEVVRLIEQAEGSR